MIKFIKKLFSYRWIRFLFVGGINTIIGYGSYALLIFLKTNYLLATTLSTIIGVINSYVWNRKFTFKSNKSIKKEIPKFASVYLISYCAGMIIIYTLVSKLNMNQYLAGLLNLVSTTLISWFGHKYISFRE